MQITVQLKMVFTDTNGRYSILQPYPYASPFINEKSSVICGQRKTILASQAIGVSNISTILIFHTGLILHFANVRQKLEAEINHIYPLSVLEKPEYESALYHQCCAFPISIGRQFFAK
jgi:hypothetical protein